MGCDDERDQMTKALRYVVDEIAQTRCTVIAGSSFYHSAPKPNMQDAMPVGLTLIPQTWSKYAIGFERNLLIVNLYFILLKSKDADLVCMCRVDVAG